MENSKAAIRLLIADDHQMMLDGLRAFLSGEPDIEVVAEARNGHEVIDQVHFEQVDIVVLDISMPELDGYKTVLTLKETHPDLKVLVLSLHKDENNIRNLLDAGVDGYVIKDRGSEELLKAIRSLAVGNDYFDTDVLKVMKSLMKKEAGNAKVVKLTDKEVEVLKWLAESLSSKEIGEKMYISDSTVETHKKNLIQKLKLPSARHLRTYAVEYCRNLK